MLSAGLLLRLRQVRCASKYTFEAIRVFYSELNHKSKLTCLISKTSHYVLLYFHSNPPNGPFCDANVWKLFPLLFWIFGWCCGWDIYVRAVGWTGRIHKCGYRYQHPQRLTIDRYTWDSIENRKTRNRALHLILQESMKVAQAKMQKERTRR